MILFRKVSQNEWGKKKSTLSTDLGNKKEESFLSLIGYLGEEALLAVKGVRETKQSDFKTTFTLACYHTTFC